VGVEVGGGGAGSQIIGVRVGVEVAEGGGGGGSQIIGVNVGLGVNVAGGGTGSQIIGINVGVGVEEAGGGGGSQIIGVTVGDRVTEGGGAGSQTCGSSRQLALLPPTTAIIARMALCRCGGILFHGIIAHLHLLSHCNSVSLRVAKHLRWCQQDSSFRSA
jgi:hypothetical protein